MSEKGVARPAILQYVDLAQHAKVDSHDFFQSAGLVILQCMGWTYETEVDGIEVYKILMVDDMDGDANSEGFVIPKACVLKIAYLSDEEGPHVLDKALA